MYEITEENFRLKSISFKSVNDGLTTGICSVRCELDNGVSSGELSVEGAKGQTSGKIDFPSDHSIITKAQAYNDDMGVYNLFLKNTGGEVVSSYDPKKYGEINSGKFEILPHEEIIGVYGTYPGSGSNIFSSFGLIAMSKTTAV